MLVNSFFKGNIKFLDGLIVKKLKNEKVFNSWFGNISFLINVLKRSFFNLVGKVSMDFFLKRLKLY